jgi:hypothetical protein
MKMLVNITLKSFVAEASVQTLLFLIGDMSGVFVRLIRLVSSSKWNMSWLIYVLIKNLMF